METRKNIIIDLVKSWATLDGVNSTETLLEWIKERNANVVVNIARIPFSSCQGWYYDKDNSGYIRNQNNGFFEIAGLEGELNGVPYEQPVILQKEIGFLGIICKRINGTIHLLMQSKIEPGNVNKVQLSPTIQATRSNFTQKHGGKKPAYLEYFLNNSNCVTVVDQIQSEQSSRFLGKRNRNIIIYVDEDIPVGESHRWMTLGQIKQLMKVDNLVNMDTRTVLSCIPFATNDINEDEVTDLFKDKALSKSIFDKQNTDMFTKLYSKLNDVKMFSYDTHRCVRIDELDKWEFSPLDIKSKIPYSFLVSFFEIEIEGREVRRWSQPLFEAKGNATFGLITKVVDGKRLFLVQLKKEVGCFDTVELAPSIQRECNEIVDNNAVNELFNERVASNDGVVLDVMLSEEGGRFYQEQNRNIILNIKENELVNIPSNYHWVSFQTLNVMTQVNNVLNIQLRNLLSLLEI